MTESIFRSNTIYNPLWPGFWSTQNVLKDLLFLEKMSSGNELCCLILIADVNHFYCLYCELQLVPGMAFQLVWNQHDKEMVETHSVHSMDISMQIKLFRNFKLSSFIATIFLMNKNMRLNAITFRFITFHSKKDFVWYFFHCSSTHYILWKFKYQVLKNLWLHYIMDMFFLHYKRNLASFFIFNTQLHVSRHLKHQTLRPLC